MFSQNTDICSLPCKPLYEDKGQKFCSWALVSPESLKSLKKVVLVQILSRNITEWNTDRVRNNFSRKFQCLNLWFSLLFPNICKKRENELLNLFFFLSNRVNNQRPITSAKVLSFYDAFCLTEKENCICRFIFYWATNLHIIFERWNKDDIFLRTLFVCVQFWIWDEKMTYVSL